jgi:hypothetical protein
MVGKRRLTKPTLGIAMEAGIAVTVPPGQAVDIVTTPIYGERTVDVLWNGQKLMMFVSDLEDRSQEIDS